jgi:fructuronate reductase/mannitol 2-dehydrogenase
MKRALVSQDFLFTVVERHTDIENAHVIACMKECLFAPERPTAVLLRLSDPMTRVVTLTITGDGYHLDSGGRFRPEESAVRHDLAHPDRPETWFGHVVRALALRRDAGLPGFTVLSCDNLTDSGAAARAAVMGFAESCDPSLARWIDRHVAFPNSMVDRITPGTDDDLRALVENRFGVEDICPVATEPYTQWVIEDEFCNGRPPLEDVGVQFVNDVVPYKTLKSRLLNGTHSGMAYLGYLAGHRTTAEAVEDRVMRDFITGLMREEIAPLLPAVPGIDVDDYVSTLLDRLANRSIADRLDRLCGRGSTKVPAYVLPSIVEARRRGGPTTLLTLAVAGWFRYLRGTDMSGAEIDIKDPRLTDLQQLARRGGPDPGPLLTARSVMGPLSDDLTARLELRTALEDIDRLGPLAAIRKRVKASRELVSLSALNLARKDSNEKPRPVITGAEASDQHHGSAAKEMTP